MKALWLALLITMFVLLAFQPVMAEENITEVKIENVPVIATAGTSLDFSILVGNRIGPPCTAQLDYWLADNGKKVSTGSDSLFLGSGASEEIDASLLLPSNISGIYDFGLEMNCNDNTVLANKTIEVKNIIPTMPDLGDLEISGNEEGQQFEFSYKLKTNHKEQIPIHVEEQILKDNNVVWSDSQNIAVVGSVAIERFGPILPPGNYSLSIKAIHGTETARIVREFTVSSVVPAFAFTEMVIASLLALFFIGLFASMWFVAARLYRSGHTILPTIVGNGNAEQVKNVLCPVEAESSGVLEDFELSQLLDNAKIKGNEREKTIEFVGRTPVVQITRGCIITGKHKKISCETTVTMTVSNNTNRNWKNVVVLAGIPEFLGKPDEIKADCEILGLEGSPVVKFILPKVGAMQSASISYNVEIMVSQAEANSIPLPAVIKYDEGKPLIIAQVKIEKQAESQEKGQKKKKAAKTAIVYKSPSKKEEITP